MLNEKIVGIDLAGLPKNETGFCKLERKQATTSKLKTNEEIHKKIEETSPSLIAIDGPTTTPHEGRIARQCDIELKEYGALPPLMSEGMKKLNERAINLKEKLEENYCIIEVLSTATAEILGIKRKKENEAQKQMIKMGLKGTLEERLLTIDETDALLAALTGRLHLKGKTNLVGGTEGFIVVPRQ